MASNVFRTPLIHQIKTRGYTQQAKVAVASNREAIQTGALSNKVAFAAIDVPSPLTRVTIAFKAGSRYEPLKDLGVSHMLRSAAGLTTKNASQFIIRRKLAQFGASLSTSGDRECIYYTLESSRANLPEALEVFGNMISNQEFRPWELTDNEPRLKFDVISLTPQARAVDLLHKAAFRRGLGNSLFISPSKIGKISTETLQHFANSTLTTNRCAVVVFGDNQSLAQSIGEKLQVGSGDSSESSASIYHDGDLRKEMGGELAHVAIGLQGAAANTQPSLALAVAAKALGSGPVTKWGANNSLVAKAVGNVGPFAAAGFSVSYSDAGLFGVIVSVPKDEAHTVVKNIANLLKSPSISADAIKASKNQLKLHVLSELEDPTQLVEALAVRGLTGGANKTPSQIAQEIDALSDAQINEAVAKAAKGKLTIGAAGSLACVPYSDEV